MEDMSKTTTEASYNKRRASLAKMLGDDTALIVSASERVSSRDIKYSYRADSDMLYFSGIEEPDSAICIHGSEGKKHFSLFLRDRDSTAEIWGDDRLGLRRAKRRFSFDDVFLIDSLPDFLKNKVRSERLYFSAGINDRLGQIVWNLFKSATGPQLQFARSLCDLRSLSSQLRVVKDSSEIGHIREAIAQTGDAFLQLAQGLKEKAYSSERHAARALEASFAANGATGPGFETIVAAGSNATVLHHRPSDKSLRNATTLLVDAGARNQNYSADVTRVFPLKGSFSDEEAAVYDAVRKALLAGIKKAKPDSSMDEVHSACVRSLCKSLKSLGLISGSLKNSIEKGHYKNFFMHRSGHWLGLDVHDISPVHVDEFMIPTPLRPLEPGNVFTIEPGLYFSQYDRNIPKAFRGIGVRLEEDILITEEGAEVLTANIPIERNEVEAMMGS